MRTIVAPSKRYYAGGVISRRHLFIFQFTSKTYRWTDADQNVYATNMEGDSLSHWYTARAIQFDEIELSINPQVANVSIDFDNVDYLISALAISERLQNSPVSIYSADLDRHLSVIGSILLFYGYWDKLDEADQQHASVTLVNHMIRWQTRTPRHQHQPTCWWIFRSTPGQCDYVGAADVTTAVKTQANAGAVNIDVDSTAGMNTIDSRISIVLDDATIHWSKISAVVDADTVTIVDAIPAGRYAAVDAVVQTSRWCDHSWERCVEMSNQKNFPGFRWLPYLEDKLIPWGRRI